MEIIPAIMPQDVSDLRNKLALIRGQVNAVQLDLMDGVFVRGKTWPYNGKQEEFFNQIMHEEEGLPFWDEFDFELDLMVKDASGQLDTFMLLGAKRLVFHIEAEDTTENKFQEFLEGIDLYIRDNVEIGVAINNDTPLENIFPLIHCIDFVQCMGIARIGIQGEPFDERVLERIKILHEKYEELPISVDGSINLETIHLLMEAGATRFVVGSAIWKNNEPELALAELQSLVIQ